MTIFALTCFITGILAGVTGLFVFLKDRKQKLNQLWFFFNLFVAIWMIGLGGTLAVNNQDSALFCQRILYVATIVIPVFFLQFCLVITERDKEKKFAILLKINFLLVVIFMISLFVGDFFIGKVKPKTHFDYWPVEFGWLYFPFLLWFAITVISAFYILQKELRKKELDIIKRKQISIIYFGALIGFIAGSINFLLDFNIIFPPFHNFFVSAYIIFTALAITKYHLFGIKVLLTELLVGIFSIFLLIQIFLSSSVWQYLWNIFIFITFLFFGYIFIKSIFKEIRIKQRIGEASWKVLEQGEVVSENFKKVMCNREKLLKDWFLSDVNKELEINSLKSKISELEKKYKEK